MNLNDRPTTTTENGLPLSKMLVLDPDPAALDRIRTFCTAHRVQGLRVSRHNVLSVLKSNLDLGGLMLSQDAGGGEAESQVLIQRIAASRPELPILLRRTDGRTDPLHADLDALVTCTYTVDRIDDLAPVLDRVLFSVAYPSRLVQGVSEFLEHALRNVFPRLGVAFDAPYLVRDQFIHGELFTLIPVDTEWCRGFIMMQTTSDPLEQLIRAGHTLLPVEQAEDFRTLQSVLSELTNVVWGAFKNRYQSIGTATTPHSQVPIVINHLHRYISFGSSIPQLCLRATLTDPSDDCLAPATVELRLVFNLAWSPEDFRENEAAVHSLVTAGEIEFF